VLRKLEECYPQTIDVLKTRALPQGIEIRIGNYQDVDLTDDIIAFKGSVVSLVNPEADFSIRRG